MISIVGLSFVNFFVSVEIEVLLLVVLFFKVYTRQYKLKDAI